MLCMSLVKSELETNGFLSSSQRCNPQEAWRSGPQASQFPRSPQRSTLALTRKALHKSYSSHTMRMCASPCHCTGLYQMDSEFEQIRPPSCNNKLHSLCPQTKDSSLRSVIIPAKEKMTHPPWFKIVNYYHFTAMSRRNALLNIVSYWHANSSANHGIILQHVPS